MEVAQMSSEENKAITRQILESYNSGSQVAQAARQRYFAAELVVHMAGMLEPLRGREAFEQLVKMFADAFSDDHVTVEDQIAEGDKVACRWTWSFTHRGPFQGIAPTGKRVKLGGIHIDRFAGDKIVERWIEMDQVGLMQQLGAMPAPEKGS
jgi:predicted ester cyclase